MIWSTYAYQWQLIPIIPWSVDPPHLPGKGRVLALAALLDRQRLQVVPQGAHSYVHLLDKETLHVLQHKLGHQLSVLLKIRFTAWSSSQEPGVSPAPSLRSSPSWHPAPSWWPPPAHPRSPAEKLMLEYCKSHNCGCFDHRITDLHRIIEKLMLKLFDTEDLLKEVIKLLFVHELVAQLGDRQSLPWPPLFLLCKV